ncbi:dihydroorotate dehydrogenase electron transfer subunit [Komagataeibacter oboediens]|nr:dihydroorotate dehydrogenase electron transfer subunit [Komagataeibacter oboediens]
MSFFLSNSMPVAAGDQLPPSPARNGMAHDTVGTVVSNHHVNALYKHIVITCPQTRIWGEPGQFYMLTCPPGPEDRPFFRRPMSLYANGRRPDTVEFLYKITGTGTRALATLKEGESIRLLGPLGHGFTLQPDWKHLVVVGRGVGLATLAPLVKAARANNLGVTAILSSRERHMSMSQHHFVDVGARLVEVNDDDGSSAPDNVMECIRAQIQAGQCDALFTCGSKRLLGIIQHLAREYSLPGQVALEQQMACGLGMCFSCVRVMCEGQKTIHRRVCWDGPVFDALKVQS